MVVSLLHCGLGFKPPHPEPVPVPRPGQPASAAEGNGQTAPPRMSAREEVRAFFGATGGGTEIVVSPG